MKIKRNDKNQFFILIVLTILAILLVACLLTFLINVGSNKGVVPLIFIFLALYSFLIFFYHLIYASKTVLRKKVFEIKFIYIIFLIINAILAGISIIVLWL